ncbi:MAG: pyridoxal phosphate-dependent aminotransferase [Candidatus Ratteibacteria bacterium]|jgi:aspartate aminotransferase
MISARAKMIKPSNTMAVNQLAKELKAQGEKIINLSVGEPDFPTPDFIAQAGISAIQDGFTRYTEASGTLDLRKAICEKFARDNNLSYNPSQIVVSSGAKHSLFNIFLALCDPGDEVIIPAPYWISYPEMVSLASGVPIISPFGTDYKVLPDQLKRLITPRTKLFLLNSPSNPSGIVYTKKELEDLASILLENNILTISDEVYEYFVYGENTHISIASLSSEMQDHTVVVNAVSKSYSMTGWRIGYVAAPQPLASAIASIQSQTTSNPVSISQKAAEIAISSGYFPIAPMVEEFAMRRDYLVTNLDSRIRYVRPDGAFYLLLSIGNFTSADLSKKLLDEEKLATVPAQDFGIEHFVRISFAISFELLKEAVDRLNQFAGRYG